MKKIFICLMAMLMLCVNIPLTLQAATSNPTTIAGTNPVEASEAEALISRLNEIKAMDKSKLTSPEKRLLRKEVRGIKKNLNSLGNGGVYLSVGAIIIIILLLILLL